MASFQNNGKLKQLTIIGMRLEIIHLVAVNKKPCKYSDTILVHADQNYDYNLNGVFFHNLELADPEVYMDAVGDTLGQTMGNTNAKSHDLIAEHQPDAMIVQSDTNSCLSIISSKRLYTLIFHMEVSNRCKDECLLEETNRRIMAIISHVNLCYSEYVQRCLADCGLPKERSNVIGSPMAEVLLENLAKIEASGIHTRLGLEKSKYILLSVYREENIDTEKNLASLFTAVEMNQNSEDGIPVPDYVEESVSTKDVKNIQSYTCVIIKMGGGMAEVLQYVTEEC